MPWIKAWHSPMVGCGGNSKMQRRSSVETTCYCRKPGLSRNILTMRNRHTQTACCNPTSPTRQVGNVSLLPCVCVCVWERLMESWRYGSDWIRVFSMQPLHKNLPQANPSQNKKTSTGVRLPSPARHHRPAVFRRCRPLPVGWHSRRGKRSGQWHPGGFWSSGTPAGSAEKTQAMNGAKDKIWWSQGIFYSPIWMLWTLCDQDPAPGLGSLVTS